MTILERFNKIEELKNAGETTFSFEKLERVQVDTDYEAILINDWVIIPIQVASFYDRSQSWIDVKKEDNTFLGYLYLTNKIQSEDTINSALEELLQIMHIYEHQALNEILQQDYLLIQENNFSEYVTKFYDSAPLWGNFFHLNGTISLPKTITKDKIIALPNLSLSQTNYHPSAAIRAIQQPFVFERFLKKYHLLELLFDYQFVKGLFNKNIDTELKDIVGLVQTYGREDIVRLTDIVKEYCVNFSQLENKLGNLKNYPNQIENILFKYEKKSNPVKEDFNAFYLVVNQANGFVLEEIKQLKPTITQIKAKPSDSTYPEQQANQLKSYRKFLHEFTAYCIYRIRSSVAHHKVGEYVMTNSDEEFMLKFAEPLIDEVLIQCFQTNS